MASTALPHTTHPQENLQRQYMAASPEEAPVEASSASPQPQNMPGSDSGPNSEIRPDPYQYTEASVTSGSNSGEEDCDRELNSNKRLGGHLNGFSSKKRRKQSKPIRLGPNGEGPEDNMPSQSGQDRDLEDDEGLVNSTTPELEDGERRLPSNLAAGLMNLPPLPMTSLPSDLPLNLSAANLAQAAANHPTLRVLGAELLQNPDKIPTSAAASIYQNMLSGAGNPFGLPPFPFPFPPVSRGGPPTSLAGGQTPPVSASGRPQIFNPEAYCELCNKEFCNKYFLKTHKANKHGIYSEGVPMSGSPPTSASPSNGPQSQNEPGLISTSSSGPMPPTSSSHGPPTPNSQAGSPFSGAFIAANMGSLRPPFMPLSPGASPSPKGPNAGGPQQNNHERDLQNQRDAPSNVSSSDSPLRHGGMMSPPRGPLGPGEMPDFRQTVEERERLMQRDSGSSSSLPKENGELRKSLESPQRAPSVGASPGLPGMPPVSSSGGLPGLPPHLNFNPMMFGGLPSLESLRKDELEAIAAGNKRPPIPNIPNVPNVSAPQSNSNGSIPKGPFTPEKLRQMGVINADAFCEICCKEFCNKYFLRVHKLKKHGICSPDLPPEKVQKILNQMAKEAGKTGNPPPPIVRPPMSSSSPFSPGPPGSPDKRPPLPIGPGGMPLRPPGLMSLPPLEPLLPQALKDFKPQMPPPNFDNGPQAFRHPAKDSQQQEIIRINDDSEDGQREIGIHRGPPMNDQDMDDDQDDSRGENGSEKDMGEVQRQKPSEDLQRLQSMIMELNNSGKMPPLHPGPPPSVSKEENTICKMCNKDMENKYFLRAHMMNEHGMLEDPSASEKDEIQARPPPPLLNGLDMANAQDFAAKFLQQMQKGFGAAGLPPLEGDERSFLERVKSELAAAGGGLNLNAANLPPIGPLGSPSPTGHKKFDKDPNRKPASLSRSYCDICKKELCNKYFMKTHMLKMHGINIEATNSAGVNCHICKKELCSKYFLKVHMQNSHGLMEDGSPIPPHLKENGSGLFPGMFPPLEAPPSELLGLGGPNNGSPMGPDKEHFSRLLVEQSEMSKEKMEREKQGQKGHNCSLCGEAFPEIVALQVHIIKSHGAFPPDSNAGFFGSLEGNKLPTLAPNSEPNKEGSNSPAGSNAGSASETGNPMKSNEERSEGEVTPNKAPSTPSLQIPCSSGAATPTSMASEAMASALNKQFPHIEMLQRHMLSQQFPGLINPLLSGFPGFPGGPPPLAFPNPLQQLLAGTNGGHGPSFAKNAALNSASKATSDQDADEHQKDSSSSQKSGKMKRRFKCSKCQVKFKKREDCLRHIHAQHSAVSSNVNLNSSIRRKLQFSSSPQVLSKNKNRQHYVKRLMEILRVPTSRGTPQENSEASEKSSSHIMQAFLIKKNQDQETQEEVENDFVPSMVYLPVAKKINQPLTVAFSLTPA